MKKLLIVDDEQIEREGLLAILQKAFPEVMIYQAKNGKQAVQMADEHRPDLILMDIQMPGMTGLEAIAVINSKYPDMKFVMVTAYDTFDYARVALKLGVKDYILKPSKVNEINATVSSVLKQSEEEQKSQDINKHQKEALQKALTVVETDVVTQLLFDHVHEVHLDMLVEMLDTRSSDEKFVMIVLLPPGAENYYPFIKGKIRNMKNGWVGALNGRQLPIIVFRDQSLSFRSQASALARQILAVTKSSFREGWFIGIGNVQSSLENIRQSYQESLIATMDTSIVGKYRFYEDVPLTDPKEDRHLTKQREKKYFEHVRLGQWDQVRMYILNVIHRYETDQTNLLHTQQRVLELRWIAARVMNEVGVEINTPLFSFQAQDFRQLRTETVQLLDLMQDSYKNHYESIEADTIHKIKRYIIDYSHEEISLDALGRKVGLSPIYISKIFKEKIGINYIDFLTECRIEKAKKLMSDPEKSIKEITFEVGYHEPNYFSKVFKKISGISPKEYRMTLLGKKAEV